MKVLNKNRLKMLASVIIAGLSLLSIAYAQNEIAHQPDNKSQLTTSLLPNKQKAAKLVKHETGGQVLDVKTHASDSGDPVLRVKFLKDGHVQFMDITSQSILN